MTATAAEALVATLERHGVDRVFCVPGESYLAVLDAFHDHPAIQVVTCRHESGAGFMALADAKITGRAGTVLVSRGPGATNASIALFSAEQDAQPMVLFIGQVDRKDRGRGAFQEIDYAIVFAGIAKWVVEVTDPDALATTVARAYQVAAGGTPGPVVVSLPEDMLSDPAVGGAAEPLPVMRPEAAVEDVAFVAERLSAAERPLIIAGGDVHGDAARRALLECSEKWVVPVAAGFKHQPVFPNSHPHFAGHMGYGLPAEFLEMMSGADLILAIGTRLGDVTTQNYRLPRAPVPAQPLIHVYPDADRIGRVFETARGVVSAAEPFLSALARRNPPPPGPGRAAWCARANAPHAALAKWRAPPPPADGVDFGHVIMALADALPADGVIVSDAGNFGSWVHRYFPFTPANTLISCVSGAMGGGVPGAVAAALRLPGRHVAAIVGDGGFLMTGNELATAVRYGARVRIFVSNNRSYGTIRLHQEKHYPGRVVGTGLSNPDFVALARAFGVTALAIETAEQAAPAVAAAFAADGPALVEVRTSLERISAYATLDGLAAR